ncbi:MAG TPA: hypothetical protein DCG13_04670 [Legionellales bacterium]|nr:hypothetical protein [Legionellales bacterium]HCA89622.1 hypothetical protein [Legionellales bacterium]|tara:strand:- start:1323 stop:1601 length:279 start_codon:yes stop_codon:yes gene_type:complete
MLTSLALPIINNQLENFHYVLMFINALLHLLFAGAVAQDAGRLHHLGQKPVLVSGTTWAFATLLGGVLTATLYWLIHHSTFTRPKLREPYHD